MKVGFVGLGTMGLPMTKNLLKAGFEVVVVSRSRGPIEAAVALGAKEAANPADLAAQVDVALTCLPMPETVEAVYLGENGLLAGARPGTILVDHSTVSPALNRKIFEAARAKGVHFLDAPVSGGPMGAEAGTLTIMCGGEPEAFAKAKPVFEAMGKVVVLVGPVGSGSVVKLINNLLVGVHTAALAEAFVMGAKAGIDSRVLYEILKHSTGHSYMMDRTVPLIQERDFAQRFAIDLLYKDMRIATQLAEELGVPLRLGRVAEAMVGEAQAQGHGREDVAAIIRPLEKAVGVEVRAAGDGGK